MYTSAESVPSLLNERYEILLDLESSTPWTTNFAGYDRLLQQAVVVRILDHKLVDSTQDRKRTRSSIAAIASVENPQLNHILDWGCSVNQANSSSTYFAITRPPDSLTVRQSVRNFGGLPNRLAVGVLTVVAHLLVQVADRGINAGCPGADSIWISKGDEIRVDALDLVLAERWSDTDAGVPHRVSDTQRGQQGPTRRLAQLGTFFLSGHPAAERYSSASFASVVDATIEAETWTGLDDQLERLIRTKGAIDDRLLRLLRRAVGPRTPLPITNPCEFLVALEQYVDRRDSQDTDNDWLSRRAGTPAASDHFTDGKRSTDPTLEAISQGEIVGNHDTFVDPSLGAIVGAQRSPLSRQHVLRRVRQCVSFIICLGIIWAFMLPVRFGGLMTYTVVSGTSMEPKFHTGDLVMSRRVKHYQVGDIVTYAVPEAKYRKYNVVHRIVKTMPDGRHQIRGDNRKTADPWLVGDSDILGKEVVLIARAGFVLVFLHSPVGLAIVFGLLVTAWFWSSNFFGETETEQDVEAVH